MSAEAALWLSALSWQPWVSRYTAAVTRRLRRSEQIDADIETLRRNPSVMSGTGLVQIVDQYDKFIRDLEESPILIGLRSAARSCSCCSTAPSAWPAWQWTRRRCRASTGCLSPR